MMMMMMIIIIIIIITIIIIIIAVMKCPTNKVWMKIRYYQKIEADELVRLILNRKRKFHAVVRWKFYKISTSSKVNVVP